MMEALTWKGKIESYARIKEVKKAAVDAIPEEDAEGRKQVKQAVSELVETLTRETILKAAQAARRARLRRDPAHLDRGRHAPPDPRLGPLHARRDPGPRHRHARDLGRHPADRGPRGRERAGVPPPLQLPSVLRGRGQALRLARPARDRPRPSRLAVAEGRPAGREGLPLHHPRGLRHPRVERLVVDGDDLRRLARA